MVSRIVVLLSIASVGAVSGCASQRSHFFTLASMATAGAAPPLHVSIIVGPVTVPASVDRPEFVVQVTQTQLDIDEFNRWAAPLSDTVSRTVADDLAVLLGTPDVAMAPLANFRPDYRVTITVQRFDSLPGRLAVVEAVWVVVPSSGGGERVGRTVARETVSGDGYDALAAAHSRAIAAVSADIAAAIRESAGRKS